MNIKDFEFMVVSSPDREKLTCEIYYKGEELGEITQETNELSLDVYKPKFQKWWSLPFEDFLETLLAAKQYLLQGNKSEKDFL